jgi:hypothetical protein
VDVGEEPREHDLGSLFGRVVAGDAHLQVLHGTSELTEGNGVPIAHRRRQ